MRGRFWGKAVGVVVGAALAGMPQTRLAAQEADSRSGEDCSFQADRAEYLTRQLRTRRDVFDHASKFSSRRDAGAGLTVSPSDIPRRNFIDVEIFDRLGAESVPSARLTTDEEFARRIYLDLTGRIPSAEQVREFLADSAEDKRNRVIDRLLYSPEFAEKWTMWMGDLLQSAQAVGSVNRQAVGRNTYHDWIRYSMIDGKSLKAMTWEALTASGNIFYRENGAANFSLNGRTVMGPAQDTYDWLLYQATSKFLGLSHYDCLLCHDGRRHLDDISLWGKSGLRLDAQRMAAFYSRTRLTVNNAPGDPLYQSWTVSDVATGSYGLNTNFGNRPNRAPVGALSSLNPEYRDGSAAGSANWRGEFAGKLVEDPLLAVNYANRLWKAMFNYGLVEPVDSLDPYRLDPDSPPPSPWALQPSHPRLLQLLAAAMRERDFNLREFLRLLAESSAYQLSARYEGEWNLSMVPLFARHYPRRLEGEEVHDAIVKATGVFENYTPAGWAAPIQWAILMPEPAEPRNSAVPRNFMNVFLRGDRNTQFRSQAGSIAQQLSLMNDAFVTNRTRVAASPVLKAMSEISSNAAAVDEMFLVFLGRAPSEIERGHALTHLERARTATARNAAIEDLAWALINKAEFIFSY